MNLIIDTGNTRTKTAVFENDTLLYQNVIASSEIIKEVRIILKKYKIDAIIISSVAKLPKKLTVFLENEAKLLILNSKTAIPFQNLYKTPTTLGVDRIALMAAACKKYPNKNVLVIDAGTCITYDFINKKNKYFGGAIAPGLQMKYNAMHYFTEKLPLLKPQKKNHSGNTTKSAMQLGVINGTQLEINGVIEQYQKKYKNLTIVLTGGDTIFLATLLKSTIFAIPNFLLVGLNHILNFNFQND